MQYRAGKTNRGVEHQARLRMAFVGCGAVTERIHLPAAANCDKAKLVALVDTNLDRANSLAKLYGVPHVSNDHRSVSGVADAALVAVPHRFHAPVTLDLLREGVHVLVEKPMANSAAECEEMISAASDSELVLGVGLVRRFYPASQFIKVAIEDKLIGEVARFDFKEGRIFDWPAASDSFFRKEVAGGGVLIDTGAHVLDLLLWWFGDPESVEYYDDARGGMEADCQLRLRFRNGVTGTVEMSRTRNLRNSCLFYGTRGTLEVGTGHDPTIRLSLGGHEMALSGKLGPYQTGPPSFLSAYERQLQDFADAVLTGRDPFVSGLQGKRAIELIETCYAGRRPLVMPWEHVTASRTDSGQDHEG